MYGFPSDFDPQVFVGRQLESVAYATGVIVLSFDGGVVVSASAPISFRLPDEGVDTVDEPYGSSSGRLVHLASARVESAELPTQQELLLRFRGGGTLKLVDADEHYESFLVNDGKREFAV